MEGFIDATEVLSKVTRDKIRFQENRLVEDDLWKLPGPDFTHTRNGALQRLLDLYRPLFEKMSDCLEQGDISISS